MRVHKLPADEKLRLKKSIDTLFDSGKSFGINVLRVIYHVENNRIPEGIKILVSVPRRKFKKAVTRNRIKRLMREAYRLNKEIIYQDYSSVSLNVAFIYTGDKYNIEYKELEKYMVKALSCLRETLRNAGEDLKNTRVDGEH